MSVIELKNPGYLDVSCEGGVVSVGCDQMWYPKDGFIPRGACGAAAASNLLMYLLRSKSCSFASENLSKEGEADYDKNVKNEAARYRDLLNEDEFNKTDELIDVISTGAGPIPKEKCLEFMKKVYPFFVPPIGGLLSDDFLEGIRGFSKKYVLPFKAERLIVTISRAVRPPYSELAGFISKALKNDSPVAFLILSSGSERALDTWHWVTILAFDEGGGKAKITDNGKVFWADIGKWHATSIMGGALVSAFTS